MLNFLVRNKRLPIGLDIGADSVKMLQVKQAGATWSVCAGGLARFASESVKDPAQRRKQIASAVKELLGKGAFRGRKVVTALSCGELSIKSVRLPSMPDNELREAVKWEAKDRFGFDVAPDQLSFIDAGEVRSGSETSREVIMLAAPKEVIDDHLGLLLEMKLHPVHIDAAPVALFRSFQRFLRRRTDEQSVSVLVDMGSSATRVVVARGRQIVFIKSIDIGGAKLAEAVAGQFNLSCEDARQLRVKKAREHLKNLSEQQEGQDGKPAQDSLDRSVHDAVRAQVESLAGEIALCLRYCSVTFRGLRPGQVILSGGEAYDPFITATLREHLGVECTLGRPLQGIAIFNADLAGERGAHAEWAVCAGLATWDLELGANLPEADHGENRLSA
jgi:type IV pilus assembly protein PilM